MREDGMHVNKDGNKRWYKNDKLHREDGPAVESPTGYKYWYKNGKLHREAWCLNGRTYPFDEWLEKLNIPDEDKLFLKLKWV